MIFAMANATVRFTLTTSACRDAGAGLDELVTSSDPGFVQSGMGNMIGAVRFAARGFWCSVVGALFLWPVDALAADPVVVNQDSIGAEAQDGKSSKTLPVLELRGELGAVSRRFEYHQDVNDNLRDHDDFAPLFGVGVRWYPGAHFTTGTAANLGIVGEYERSLSGSASTESGEEFDATLQRFAVGARMRFPVGPHELGASFTYGRHEFGVDTGWEPNAAVANGLAIDRNYVPDVAYWYARPGLDARFVFGRIHAGFGLGYRGMGKLGEVGTKSWFPQATGRGMDGSLMIGFELRPELVVFGGADVTRYALAMNSMHQDILLARDVAGGAIDQSISGRVGVEWRPVAPNAQKRNVAGAQSGVRRD